MTFTQSGGGFLLLLSYSKFNEQLRESWLCAWLEKAVVNCNITSLLTMQCLMTGKLNFASLLTMQCLMTGELNFSLELVDCRLL